MSVAELPPEATLIDVREQDEWDAGHAPGAVHIPLGELPDRLGDLPEADALYLVCRSGGRSSRAAAFLNANGWEAINVSGGMRSWHAEGKQLIGERAGSAAEVL
ncbi:rhodanese-related sulfurtransferase [Tamaricihabitans halophyticus]|uniref:Rhodanese-related sulfurtransferase n=1 Tax=Tamaricihabitans halophyticus TaxID=1262583 RepID=A0A4V2SV66_9PSEU|nr:rhodanese-related sulfurtransferase [Tamaricihabitans halophyticus]